MSKKTRELSEKEAAYIVYLTALNALLTKHLMLGNEHLNLNTYLETARDYCNEKSLTELRNIAKERVETCPIWKEIKR